MHERIYTNAFVWIHACVCLGIACMHIHMYTTIDAASPRLLSQRVRVALYFLAAVGFMYEGTQRKINSAEIYQRKVPEVVIEGFAELDTLSILLDTCATIALLSLHACYRCWRYPTQAVLIQEAPWVSDLYGTRTLGASDRSGVQSAQILRIEGI